MKDLKLDLKNKVFKKCYLFYGDESYLMKKYETKFVKTILDDSQMAMNLEIITKDNIYIDDLLKVVETYPFFAEKRVVVVHNSNFFKKGTKKDEGAKLIPYMENLPDTCVLIFIENEVEKNNALYKAVNKFYKVAEFTKLDNKDINTWIKRELKNNNITMNNGVLNYFIENIDNNMEQISNEIQKLSAFEFESGEVTIKDINDICSLSLESRVFELSNGVINGNALKACEIYKNLLSANESPFGVLYLLIMQFRTILMIKALKEENKTVQEIAKIIKSSDYRVKILMKDSSRFSLNDIKKIIILAQETDQNIKSGFMNEEVAVELFIMRLCSSDF